MSDELKDLFNKLENMSNEELLKTWKSQDWSDDGNYSYTISMDDYRQYLYTELGNRGLSAL